MTVTYTAQVASSRRFSCFLKLLARWRGSIYRLIWDEVLIYLLLYAVLSLIYRVALNESQRRLFEQVSIYCETYSNLIPLSFVLGFYVSLVVSRWWNQFTTIPWPDSCAVLISAYLQGQDERSRVMRRNVMRYLCLSYTIVLTMISAKVKRRFPTMSHLVEAGLLLENEKKIFDQLKKDGSTDSNNYWMPIVWATHIVSRARKEGKIRDDMAMRDVIQEIANFRSNAGMLLCYDYISVPLVYTQVVTLAVYSFFLAGLMGRQWLDPDQNLNKHKLDLYFPIFTVLELVFYMGWLKVAECLLNPFGDDDDDFEVNFLIDRNLMFSYLVVDKMHDKYPLLIRDHYWDKEFPSQLPYTKAAQNWKEGPPKCSTSDVIVTNENEKILQDILVDNLSEADAGGSIPLNNVHTQKPRLPTPDSTETDPTKDL